MSVDVRARETMPSMGGHEGKHLAGGAVSAAMMMSKIQPDRRLKGLDLALGTAVTCPPYMVDLI